MNEVVPSFSSELNFVLPHWSKMILDFWFLASFYTFGSGCGGGMEGTGTLWLTCALCLQAACSRLCRHLGSPTCALLALWWCRPCLRQVPWMPWEASLQPVAQAPRLWPRQVEWSAVSLGYTWLWNLLPTLFASEAGGGCWWVLWGLRT